jgi:hypothetical protein
MRGEMDDVLTRSFSDLENQPLRRQNLAQDVEDGVAIAGGGGGEKAGVVHAAIMPEIAGW